MCKVERTRSEFATEPPTRLTITKTRDEFDADGTVQDMHKPQPETPHISKKPATLQELRHEIEESCVAETCARVCRSIAHCCQQCLDANGEQFERLL